MTPYVVLYAVLDSTVLISLGFSLCPCAEFGTGSGVCQVFSKVTGSTPDSGSGTVSSGLNPSPKVWPSYPASSPWVTATGSTRLIQVRQSRVVALV